jgi:hypothetical protein
MDSHKAYRYLGLEKYTKDELKDRFRTITATPTATATATAITTATSANYDSEQEHQPQQLPEAANAKSSLDQETLRSYLSDTIRREETDHDDAFFKRNNMMLANSSGSSIANDDIETTTATIATTTAATATATAARIDRLRTEFIEAESLQLWRFLAPLESKTNTTTTTITESEFVERLIDSATSIDRQRLWPLTLSMVMIGLSVGVTTPAFPFVVQNLGLTTGEYGMVVSAFALTKLLGNIPFAVLVERNGRKVRYVVLGLRRNALSTQ